MQLAALPTLPTATRWSVAVSARPAWSPAIGGEQVFVVLQSGIVAAHRLSDGGETWHVELRAEQAVVVEGSNVLVTARDAVHALDAASGSVAWVAPTGKLTAPLLAQNGWLIAASQGGQLSAFRTDDGTKLWSRDLGAQSVRPTIEGNTLYAPLDDGHVHAIDLQTGNDRWTRHLPGAPSEVLALSDRIYVGSADRFFYCYDAATGELEWMPRLGAVLRGRPAVEDDRVIVTSIDNMVRGYDRNSGALRWHRSVPFRPAAPTVIGSWVVVPGTSAELQVFEVATGKSGTAIKLESTLAMPPAFGTSAGAPVMAAFTGGLNDQWKLVLTGPPAPPPSAPLESWPPAVLPLRE
jgi:outer membrane protein assembly factor BamB